jgi:hypothetical protein
MFVDTLAEDLAFDRAIDTYIRVMGIPEPLASTVATRTLVVLGQDLVPYRRRARDGDPGEDDSRPKLRLDDASDGRSRIRRPNATASSGRFRGKFPKVREAHEKHHEHDARTRHAPDADRVDDEQLEIREPAGKTVPHPVSTASATAIFRESA